MNRISCTLVLWALFVVGCSPAPPGTTSTPATSATPFAADPAKDLQHDAAMLFPPLSAQAVSTTNPVTEPKVALGRTLFHDPRLSRSQTISCNSCHSVSNYGVDGHPTSTGFRGQLGGRNSPTVFNAAWHFKQFWDGRSATVEEQAKGPVLNPVEMAMPDSASVEGVLRSIPGYQPLFAKAFPGVKQPVTFDNAALAIAAFERQLSTPGAFDQFLLGDLNSLNTQQQRGLESFIKVGCASCHGDSTLGGRMFQKLGVKKDYPTKDVGRFGVTKAAADKQVFKVPSLRNIAKTGPYFHDGSITELPVAVKLMARHQLGKELSEQEVADIVSFLHSLTGVVPASALEVPSLPPSGPTTPGPRLTSEERLRSI